MQRTMVWRQRRTIHNCFHKQGRLLREARQKKGTETLRFKGYTLNERLVRPAMVIVSA